MKIKPAKSYTPSICKSNQVDMVSFQVAGEMCPSDAALFGRNALWLPLKNISLGYRLEKTRLVLELRQSSDQLVRNTSSKVWAGRAWKAEDSVDHAISNLKYQEFIRRTQQGRCGLGYGKPQKLWSKVCMKEQKKLVVKEVIRMEEGKFLVKSISQSQQGQWIK